MADDRPLEDPAEQARRQQQEIDDLKALINARMHRRPTGDTENTFRTVPKDGTLFCHGQTVNRSDYPDLWQFALDQGLVLGGLAFGVGDGATTFVLPDTRGRVLVGAGSLGVDTYAVGTAGGAARVTLSASQLPTHKHNVAVGDHAAHDHTFAGSAAAGGSHAHGGGSGSAGGHSHGGSVGTGGSHNGHNLGSRSAASALAGSQDFNFSVADTTQNANGSHSHTITTDTAAGHTHTVPTEAAHTHTLTGDVGAGAAMSHAVTEATVGTGAQVDARMPFCPINVLIWT